MSANKIENDSGFQIPEMPRRVHLPALLRRLDAETNPDIIESRDNFLAQLAIRGINQPQQLQHYREVAAVSLWLHRNDKPRKATDKPQVTHPFDVAADVAADNSVRRKFFRLAVDGALLHDTVENNKHVTEEGLKQLFGPLLASDVMVYSKKSAADKAAGKSTQMTPEEYLEEFVKTHQHRKIVKVRDRLYNMRTMPQEAIEMYDRYFRRETDAFVLIIKSLGRKGKKLYEEYRETHNKHKPDDVAELPPYKDIK